MSKKIKISSNKKLTSTKIFRIWFTTERALTFILTIGFASVTFYSLNSFNVARPTPKLSHPQVDPLLQYLVVSSQDTLLRQPNPTVHTNLKYYYSINAYKLNKLSKESTDVNIKKQLENLSKDYQKKSIESF
jgi:hypothetical protein